MKNRKPQLGDKISIEGAITTVISFPLFQAEAPHFFEVADSSGSTLRVEFREGVWAVPGKAIKAVKTPPPARVPSDFARVRRLDAVLANKIPAEPSAPAPELSPAVRALHRELDEARDRYRRAVSTENGDAMLNAWPEYERCMIAVDQADPGFYLGRRASLEARPYIRPEIQPAEAA